MQKDSIKMLYRYTTAERASCVLVSQKIFIPNHKHFNDPFDCAIELDKNITAEEFVYYSLIKHRKNGWTAIKKELGNYIQEDCTITDEKRNEILKLAREFDEKNSILGVLCLSEDPLSPLMLAHYADKHKGVCIGFLRSPENDLGDDEATLSVNYSDDYPMARFSEILKRDGSLTRKLLQTKAKDWAYEKEWRLFIDKGNDFAKIPGEIVEVILGCRIENSNEEIIKNECKKQKIPIFKYEKVPNQFKYKKVEL